MQDVLSRGWYLVFFIYGLAFFLMGFGIAFQARRPSAFYLARHLWLLAGFGLLHGTAEWAYIFIPPSLTAGGLETLRGSVLNGGHAILIAVSFAFLFAFGISLLFSIRGWLPWLSFLILGVWIWCFILAYPANPALLPGWLNTAEIAARYALALPGAVLTSLGLYFQRREIRTLQHPSLERSLVGASLAFAFYAFAGGLVVPPASFLPASLLNTSLLLKAGFPVQFLRATAGVLIAYSIIRSLDLYEIENRRKLEALQQRELIWLERERIRRDLHDRIIQGIYGLALGISHALNLLKEEPGACAARLKDLEGRADFLIAELRRYLRDFHFSSDLPDKGLNILHNLLDDFTTVTGLTVQFGCRGSQEKSLAPVQRDHFRHLVVEILSNIRRHAAATKVEMELVLEVSGLRLTVRDNGVGFVPGNSPSRGWGLSNLRARAALAGGWVDIQSSPGQGTEVVFWIPYEPPTGGGGFAR